ncbi:MAG: 23S rRNA (uracil(1939)-C(5))-methyltransferase RlmD [Erysipelotrichaceae bacterium]
MLKEGSTCKVKINQLNSDGIAEVNLKNDHLFISQVLENEEVMVRIDKRLKFGYAATCIKVLKPSVNRCTVKCPIYNKCGSCQLLHVDYEAQKIMKKKAIQLLIKHSKVANIKVNDVIGMEDPYHYRNKMIISFARDRSHGFLAGFYEENSHQIIPFEGCLLHDQNSDKLILDIINLVKKMHIEPYDENRRSGLLRHILIRKAITSNQVMVVLVVTSQNFPGRKNFVQSLCAKHPSIKTIIQNINTRKTSIVLGEEERILYGPGFVEDTLCGLKFKISAKSFYQINHDQTQRLYNLALSKIKWQGKEIVMDAYSGIGTIGMCVAKYVKEVVSVELNKDAVKDAIQNAAMNQIKNIRFICDDAGNYMQKCAAAHQRIDVVMIDPPRSGSDEKFLSSLVKLNPKQVIYISCNPTTQIRDLEYLKKYHYECEEMELVDQFPQTSHVESVVLLTLK